MQHMDTKGTHRPMKSTLKKPSYRSSRRSLVKGTVVGVASLAAAGGIVGGGVLLAQQHQSGSAHADTIAANPTPIPAILNIAATAETLAVVFYTQVLANADYLDLRQTTRVNIHAALVEEQIHLNFLNSQGAKALTQTFSFPHGRDTFQYLDLFLKTQQQLESAFVAAYLAAVKEFAQQGRPDLAQIAGQIGAIEAEHRVLGRFIGAWSPANNEAFAPLLLNVVADAPAFLKGAGYLNPTGRNSFSFHAASTNFNGVIDRTPGTTTTTTATVTPTTTTTVTPTTAAPTTVTPVATFAPHLKF